MRFYFFCLVSILRRQLCFCVQLPSASVSFSTAACSLPCRAADQKVDSLTCSLKYCKDRLNPGTYSFPPICSQFDAAALLLLLILRIADEFNPEICLFPRAADIRLHFWQTQDARCFFTVVQKDKKTTKSTSGQEILDTRGSCFINHNKTKTAISSFVDSSVFHVIFYFLFVD